jgi:hypothetical protein
MIIIISIVYFNRAKKMRIERSLCYYNQNQNDKLKKRKLEGKEKKTKSFIQVIMKCISVIFSYMYYIILCIKFNNKKIQFYIYNLVLKSKSHI